MTAAIIIARGGSRRLPRKNAKPFCGLPLVAWTIIQAKCSRLVDWVYLSTDDDEIAEIGQEHGAEVIRRPDWEDADLVAANRVYMHALDWLEERGRLPDVFACMFPTSPLRFPDDLDRGLEHFNTVGGPHVMPAAPLRETNLYYNSAKTIAKLVIWDKGYRYLLGNSGMFNITRPSWYRWFNAKLMERFDGNDHDANLDDAYRNVLEHADSDSYFVECKEWQCVEADTLDEFVHAEALMEAFILKGQGPDAYHDYARASVPKPGNWRQQ